MLRSHHGTYESIPIPGGKGRAYTPLPLPPQRGIRWTPELLCAFEKACLALGRLEGFVAASPLRTMVYEMELRREAIFSSRIEGKRVALTELLLFERGYTSIPFAEETREVANCVSALRLGIEQIDAGFPPSLRMFKAVHAALFSTDESLSGEFRTVQNWIGDSGIATAEFIPPPASNVLKCMVELERFLQDYIAPTSILQKAALSHAQFETIHPFLDGNGQMGRIIIALILRSQKACVHTVLDLSQYFMSHRQRYFNLLDQIREAGQWEEWLEFFANAVASTATQAIERLSGLHTLVENDRSRVAGSGRAADSAMKVFSVILQSPITTANELVAVTDLTHATVDKALVHLERLGITRELTARRRNRLFAYYGYLDSMGSG